VLAQSEIPEQTEAWPLGLREHGWIDGRNLQITYRYWGDHPERIPALAAELIALQPEVIVAVGPSALTVHATAPTVPLVFLGFAEPMEFGLVASLAHPGGTATGIATIVGGGFHGKQLQLLKDLVPGASRIAVLIDPKNPVHQRVKPELPDLGRQVGVSLVIVEASALDQAETAFEAASNQDAQAVFVFGDNYLLVHSPEMVSLAARYRLPAIWLFRQNVLDGGLISRGPDLADFWRRAGYVDKILNGQHPADLPVWRPNGYHVAVNLKTAAALGITVPPLILVQADEVIE
jgi:putative tryptophan/tyrosine transport system substrate-binding protein